MICPDKLDALIAATPSPVIAVTREQLVEMSQQLRAGNAARALLAGQKRMGAAIAGIGTQAT